MLTAGYSGTPLPKKLGLKPGSSCLLTDAPAGLRRELELLEPSVSFQGPTYDVVLLFATGKQDLLGKLDDAILAMERNGGLWVCWPKKSSQVATDLTENVLRDFILDRGLVDNKVCAIDDQWSALRFVWRKELR